MRTVHDLLIECIDKRLEEFADWCEDYYYVNEESDLHNFFQDVRLWCKGWVHLLDDPERFEASRERMLDKYRAEWIAERNHFFENEDD